MNEISAQLKIDVLDKWDTLNFLLTEQVAVRPDRSEHTRIAGKIAAALLDIIKRSGAAVGRDSAGQNDLAVLREIADTAKTSIFASAAKKDLLSVTAYFEADGDGKYRFLRNSLVIDNKHSKPQEVLEVVKRVCSGLIYALDLDIEWDPPIKLSRASFEDQVVLRSPTDAGTSVNIQFFKRNTDGGLDKFEPKSWEFNLLPPA